MPIIPFLSTLNGPLATINYNIWHARLKNIMTKQYTFKLQGVKDRISERI